MQAFYDLAARAVLRSEDLGEVVAVLLEEVADQVQPITALS